MEPSFLPAYHAPSGPAQPGGYNWGQEQRRRKRQFQSNYTLQDGLFAQQAPVQVDSRHNLSAPQLGSRTGVPHSGLTSPCLHGRQSTLAMRWWHRFCLFLALFCPSCICIMSPQSAAMATMATMTAMALLPPLEVTWFCDIIVAARWTLNTGLAGPFIAGEDNTESISSQGRWGSLHSELPPAAAASAKVNDWL